MNKKDDHAKDGLKKKITWIWKQNQTKPWKELYRKFLNKMTLC